MNLYLRLLWLLLTARLRPACDLLGPCETPMRVWPNDLDIYRHMNNGRYFTLLDLARTDLMIRAGLLSRIKAAGWFPVVTMETMQFRRALTLMQKVKIVTRVLGWDAKSIFLEQHFVRSGEIVASAVIRARFLRRSGGSVPTAELMALAGHDEPSPPLPQWVTTWAEATAEQS
ncbi:acyl-CoA thioesterase [Chitiniphilus purpureus]|uniref:Acyl-CoA thioesterase n=1 Tax=Chitiniphilus purpureus TaxID=2981137 RepID=A0ABY6DU06_9NEIS|nr:acyl-CoA thioesterase [Chitiniphilus sp. CD1]UXY16976.1 acyl-CoA thioesterase [Chitiniphilus sp. CD1]